MERVRLSPQKPEPRLPVLNRVYRLDEKVIRQFVELIKLGLAFDGICDYLSIHADAFWRWKRAGEKFLAEGSPPELEICGEFVLQIRRALAEYRLTLAKKAHTSKDWFRNLTLLERRDRKTYGRNEPVGGSDETLDPDESFL